MIRDIRPTGNPEVVVARGPLYDLDAVLETTVRFVRHFVHQVRVLGLGEEAEIAYGDPMDWEPLTDSSYTRIRTAFTLVKASKEGYDAGPLAYLIRVGPFKIRLGLLGYDCLYLNEEGYHTVEGAPPETYDPTPKILVTARWHFGGMLEKDDAELAKAFADPFLSSELSIATPLPPDGSAPPMLILAFRHETFGAGEGEMRIDVTETE